MTATNSGTGGSDGDGALRFDPFEGLRPDISERIARLEIWDMVWQIDPPMANTWGSLERYRKSGVSHLSVTLAGDDHSPGAALAWLAQARNAVQARSDYLALAEDAADIAEARRAGRLAISFHFEGSECFARNLDLVGAFRRLGIRHTLIAFNKQNSAGGGCAEVDDAGLTRFGRLLVREMERVGMVVDLSHVGERTSLDVMTMATRPVMFTHSNPKVLYPHFRNISDRQIDACAETGGVVGVSGSTMYMDGDVPRTELIFRQIDYLVQRVGPLHVGFGFDTVFDGDAVAEFVRQRPDEWPQPLDKPLRYSVPEQIPAIVAQMVDAGYDEAAVAAIAGGNFARLYAAGGLAQR